MIRCQLAGPGDAAAVTALLGRSYPALLAADYPADLLALVLPLMTVARPELLASGRYWLALRDGLCLGAGGWSMAAPGGGVALSGLGHIRHLATDPAQQRRGIGTALMRAILTQAGAEGITRFDCLSTRGAVPFYAAQGFRALGPVDVPMAAGMTFPAVRMLRGPDGTAPA